MQVMQDKIKVVIVDDEPQSIHRLQNDLATQDDFEVIATSSSAVSAKNLVMSMQPDVLFLDVEMPGQTGLDSSASRARFLSSPRASPCCRSSPASRMRSRSSGPDRIRTIRW